MSLFLPTCTTTTTSNATKAYGRGGACRGSVSLLPVAIFHGKARSTDDDVDEK